MKLFPQTSTWVDRTLAGMTLAQKVGQLLHVTVSPNKPPADYAAYFNGVEPGGVFLFTSTWEQMSRAAASIQKCLSAPALIASDMENGAGRMVPDATQFPDLMGIAATGNLDHARAVGRSAALEARAIGVHWTFGPVADINAHPHNPIASTRAFGDSPERVERFASAVIAGMQENGLAATAKHFPGDGYDDRDQHACTTVNPLPMEAWFRQSGRVFQTVIDKGVLAIMIGHIALPAWDGDAGGEELDAPPAVLSRRIVTDLLRGKLGFEGVVISDAMGMGGTTSWGSREETLVRAINAGCDQVLFVDTGKDFQGLLAAAKDGRISAQRLDEAVRRVLQLKEHLGLASDAGPRPLDAGERPRLAALSRQVAEDSITLVRDVDGRIPMDLGAGKRVFSFHFPADPMYHVFGIDDLLRARGCLVTTFGDKPGQDLPPEAELLAFDAILIHTVFGPNWGTGRIRLDGNPLRELARVAVLKHPKLAMISYGSPYHLYELPRMPAYINAYAIYPPTLAAVIRVLAGEIPARGQSPVDLQAPYRLKAAWVREMAKK